MESPLLNAARRLSYHLGRRAAPAWHLLTFKNEESSDTLTVYAPLDREAAIDFPLALSAGIVSRWRPPRTPSLVFERRGHHWYFDTGEDLLRFVGIEAVVGRAMLGGKSGRYWLSDIRPYEVASL